MPKGPVTVLFDFDGTLCDSLPTLGKILNSLSSKYHFKPITEQMIPELRGLGTMAILRKLEIPILKVPAIAGACRKALNDEKLIPFPGIQEQLALLPRKGILSSNSKENISRFLKQQNIEMDWIYSGSSLLGKSRLLKKCMKERGLDANAIVYVGDEIRDVEAAKAVGIRCVGVAWGLHSAEALRAAGADAVVEDMKTLAGAIF